MTTENINLNKSVDENTTENMSVENKKATRKNTIRRSYMIDMDIEDMLKLLRAEYGISSSWLINRAVRTYCEKNYHEELGL